MEQILRRLRILGKVRNSLRKWKTLGKIGARKKASFLEKIRLALHKWKQLSCKRCLDSESLNTYIDKRIRELPTKKFQYQVVITTHDAFISEFASCVFTNFIRDTFTKAFVSQYVCSDCKGVPEQRCHGIGDERPVLIRRALERIWPDTTRPVVMRDVMIAFLQEHKGTKFTFKCASCHLAEKKTCRL